MKQSYIPISKRSGKKKLRDKIGALHFKILKRLRGEKCEICGNTVYLGRFHIIRVSRAPRLEFYDGNVLIACWWKCHYAFHHYGANDPRCEFIVKRIKELKGDNYEEKLMAMNFIMPRLNNFRLELIHTAMEQEWENLKGNVT